MNAVIYARYSSAGQTEQSIEGQLRVCNEFARANNYIIIDNYIDRAMTGTNDNRPSFLQMIQDAKKKQFEFIIVYKLDRFSRNTYDSIYYKHQLEQYGVKVLSATESISDSMEGKLIERILETMAEMYSNDLSQKVKRGIRESIIKKNFLGGKPPYGYKVENKKLIIDNEKSQIVKFIFNEYAKGTPNINIIQQLNKLNYKTAKNKPFTKNSLQHLLKNKKYIGILNHNNEEIDNYCPAIIEKNLFLKVQDMLAKNKHYSAKRKAKEKFLLTGHIYCGYCGKPIVGISGTSHTLKRHSYYICSNKYKYHNCNKKTENKNILEQDIIQNTIKTITKNKKEIIENTFKIIQNATHNTKIKELETKIKSTDKELDNIFSQFIKTNNQEITNRLNKQADDLTKLKETYKKELSKLKLLQKNLTTIDEIEYYFNKYINLDISNIDELEKFINTFINCIYLFDNKIIIYTNIDDIQQEVSFDEMNQDCKTIFNNKVHISNLTLRHNILYTNLDNNTILLYKDHILGIVLKKASIC